jgi:hypothetical protein
MLWECSWRAVEIHCRDQEAFYIAGEAPMVDCDVFAAAA